MAVQLKNRILSSFINIILFLALCIFCLGFYVIKKNLFERAQTQVEKYLYSARVFYESEIERIGSGFALVNFETEDLALLKEKMRLDYLYKLSVADMSDCPSNIVAEAFTLGEALGGTRIIQPEELADFDPALRRRISIRIQDTPKALTTSLTVLDSAMSKEYAMPIRDASGVVTDIVYGGRIINRDYYLVDRIRNLVFGDGLYKSKPIGTVTIFQGDTRISTNVLDEHNQRAVGTRVSAEVYEQVVDKGQRWHDRAFVVTHWYKTAYEPIRDIQGRIIGILYVGTLETPFSDTAKEILLMFVFVLLIGSAVAILFTYILAGSISAALSRLLEATRKLSRGELGHEVSTNSSIEELNLLAESFNEMSRRLHLRESSLKINQEKLETLNKSYLDLLGFVAHELKGLLASAIMNSYSLRDGFLGMINFKQKRAVDSICRNLDYLAATVKKFLNLSRIERGNLEVHKTTFLLNKEVFDYSIKTFSKLIEDKKINVVNEIDPELTISADMDLIQIVANNLINNAAKYGSEEGQIVLRSSVEGAKVKVEVYNDGRPIAEKLADQLFKKFSRLDVPERKTVKGTGLGLYITKQIIESHGGTIYVEPRENGNSFIFVLERE